MSPPSEQYHNHPSYFELDSRTFMDFFLPLEGPSRNQAPLERLTGSERHRAWQGDPIMTTERESQTSPSTYRPAIASKAPLSFILNHPGSSEPQLLQEERVLKSRAVGNDVARRDASGLSVPPVARLPPIVRANLEVALAPMSGMTSNSNSESPPWKDSYSRAASQHSTRLRGGLSSAGGIVAPSFTLQDHQHRHAIGSNSGDGTLCPGDDRHRLEPGSPIPKRGYWDTVLVANKSPTRDKVRSSINDEENACACKSPISLLCRVISYFSQNG